MVRAKCMMCGQIVRVRAELDAMTLCPHCGQEFTLQIIDPPARALVADPGLPQHSTEPMRGPRDPSFMPFDWARRSLGLGMLVLLTIVAGNLASDGLGSLQPAGPALLVVLLGVTAWLVRWRPVRVALLAAAMLMVMAMALWSPGSAVNAF